MNRWALMAEFGNADALLAAARAAHAAGYRRTEAYSPFEIEGLAAVMGRERNSVAFFTFIGGVVGGAGGFFLQWYSAVVDYAVNIAGRPFNSWPMFIPVTFEMAVLGAAFAAVAALLAGCGLPRLRHPLFASRDFDLATRNRFFLCLRADDPAFDPEQARRLLQGLGPLALVEVPACD
jgi:hypothetical protein